MAIETNINELVINKLTKTQYKEAQDAGLINETELYLVTDSDISGDVIVDNVVTEGSINPVTGDAVYRAIEESNENLVTSLESSIDINVKNAIANGTANVLAIAVLT